MDTRDCDYCGKPAVEPGRIDIDGGEAYCSNSCLKADTGVGLPRGAYCVVCDRPFSDALPLHAFSAVGSQCRPCYETPDDD